MIKSGGDFEILFILSLMTFCICERFSDYKTDILRVSSKHIYDKAFFLLFSLVNNNCEYVPQETNTFDTFPIPSLSSLWRSLLDTENCNTTLKADVPLALTSSATACSKCQLFINLSIKILLLRLKKEQRLRIFWTIVPYGTGVYWGHTVAQLVGALCYKLEAREFDFR
jgi:hypothetical protein